MAEPNNSQQPASLPNGTASYRALAHVCPAPVIITDLNLNILVSNSHAAAILGFDSPDEMAGRSLLDFISAQDHPALRADLRRVISSGRLRNLERMLLRRDGSSLLTESSASLITGPQGQRQATLLVIRDLTERMRAQETQARPAAIVDSSDYAIFSKTLDGTILSWNRGAERMYGYTAEEVIGRPISILAPPDRKDEISWILERISHGERIDHFETVRLKKSGEQVHVSLTISPILDSAGRIIAASTIARNITERVQAEEQARNERRRLEALQGTSPVAILAVDADCNVTIANREIVRIFGPRHSPGVHIDTYRRGIVFRRPDSSVYSDCDMPIKRALNRGEQVWAEEMHIEGQDGARFLVLVNALPLRSSDGTIEGAIAAYQDITALEEAERLRNEFLGMVSHELRNPLTIIRMSVDSALADRMMGLPETRHLFDIIKEQAVRLKGLVDNLLDITQIEAGTLSIAPESSDLKAAIEEAVATFSTSGAAQQVLLEMPDVIPPVNIDRPRIVQVILNLLSNAAKSSPAWMPITVTVSSDSDRVSVRVRDQGRGIAPHEMPGLFRKFSRLEDTTRGGTTNVGIGLAICKGIVEAHGGYIWAESPGVGMGATFVFTLPIAEDGRPAPEPSAAPDAMGSDVILRPSQRPRILAVDDDLRVLRHLQRSLDRAGYEVAVTADASQVVELIDAEQPDLVLLDLKLSGASGFEVLKRVRELSTVPVIMLTASEQEANMVQALSMGADDYITKPFSPQGLGARIKAVLRRRLPSQAKMQPPLELGGLVMDFVRRRVTVEGREVSLSAAEYRLLYELATNAGRLLTHEQLAQALWGTGFSGGASESIRSFIRDIRHKLGDDPRDPRFIITQRGIGYMMPSPRQ